MINLEIEDLSPLKLSIPITIRLFCSYTLLSPFSIRYAITSLGTSTMTRLLASRRAVTTRDSTNTN